MYQATPAELDVGKVGPRELLENGDNVVAAFMSWRFAGHQILSGNCK